MEELWKEFRTRFTLSIVFYQDSSHFDAFRDSGVIDDEYGNSPLDHPSGNSSILSSTPKQHKSLSEAVQNLQLEETPEIQVRMRRKVNDNHKESDNTTSTPSTCSSTEDQEDSENSRSTENDFWRHFMENGFNSEDNLEIENLLKSMTISQRKSFICGKFPRDTTDVINPSTPNEISVQENQTGEEENLSHEAPIDGIPQLKITSGETIPYSPKENDENSESGEFKEKIIKSEKRFNRISQFGMKGIKLVRQRRRSSKKRESTNKDRKSSIESREFFTIFVFVSWYSWSVCIPISISIQLSVGWLSPNFQKCTFKTYILELLEEPESSLVPTVSRTSQFFIILYRLIPDIPFRSFIRFLP